MASPSRKIEKVCECGKTFTTYLSINKRHCSQACSSRFVPRKPRLGETVACLICGAPVYRNKSQAAKGEGQYCSRACHDIAQSKEPVLKTCANCGKELRLKPSQSHIQYCSRACQSTARTQRPLERLYNGRPARLDAKGYVLVWEPTHPCRSFKGWQLEHRLVMERAIGRVLRSDEVVHHVNGIKNDNRLENLEVMNDHEHAALSSQDYRNAVRQMRIDAQHMHDELAEYRRRFGPLVPEKEPATDAIH